MRILVTGAKGFIGAHLVRALDDHNVFTTDRNDADLSQPGEAAHLIETVEPEYVIHLAARYGRLLCRDEPHEAVCDNAAATTEIAALCAERGVGVLYASSSEVYGDHSQNVITEESELKTPTTIYGLSKRWGEEALSLYLNPDRLTIARLNMLYGPEQRGGYGCCALATFIRDALEGRRLNVHHNSSRSWLYIDDAVKALKLLIDKGGIWNVGNDRERLSMVQCAGVVCDQIGGVSMDVTHAPRNQIRHKVYSSKKLEDLGWRPEIRTREGIKRTIEAAKANGMRDYKVMERDPA